MVRTEITQPGEMKGLTAALSQQSCRSWGQSDLEAQDQAGSSPDNAGTGWHYQTTWVRQARWKGVAKANQWQKLRKSYTGSNLVDVGRGVAHAPKDGATPNW